MPARVLTRRERAGLITLAVVFTIAVSGVALLQIIGNPMGAPCRDSYSCRGFLIGGAECVEDVGVRTCTRYCRGDHDCPAGWRCESAHPTLLTVPTDAEGLVCVPLRALVK